MKKGITVIGIAFVVILLGAIIPNLNIMRNRIPHGISGTLSRLNNLSNAIQLYEGEYSRRLYFISSFELLEILQGKNENSIEFYSFSNSERNLNSQIIDYWEVPIIAVSHEQGYTLISAGPNQEFDQFDDSDDITFHIRTKHNQSGDGQ